jgi:hypothetical protein
MCRYIRDMSIQFVQIMNVNMGDSACNCNMLGSAISQTVSRRPLAAEARVRARFNTCGICGGQSGTGQVLLRVLRFFPVNIIPPSLSKLITSGE